MDGLLVPQVCFRTESPSGKTRDLVEDPVRREKRIASRAVSAKHTVVLGRAPSPKPASPEHLNTTELVMPAHVRIPTPLRKLTNNEEVIEVHAATIGEAITELQGRYPGIKERLIDETGGVRRFVNVYVNEEDIRFLQNQETKLKDGDEISIIPAIAGG